MDISGLNNKLIAVLGYGLEGQATAKYLLKHGIKPVLFDQRPWEEWSYDEQNAIKKLGLNFIFGPDCFKELEGFNIAFRSPGIKLSSLNLAHFVKKGLVITSQTKWFFENSPGKIIGVTGTKGKGTTSALIYEMLKQRTSSTSNLEPRTYLTGNIGKAQPLDFIDDLKPNDWIVYELSSFQLQDLEQSPRIAVVLMVTSEHLNYHKDVEEYVEAKSNITKHQKPGGFAVINADFESSLAIGRQGKAKKLYFSRKKVEDADCYVQGSQIVAKDFRFPIANLQLKGAHNLENICAAVLAARCARADFDAIKSAIINFKGLEHRLEFVAEKAGVKFYNDSFSTTPETAIAAIESFSEPLVIILGGSAKKADFTGLGKAINASKNIKAIILVGEEAPKIKLSLGQGYKGQIFEGAKNMPEIFTQIKSAASAGDVVLLSPACASFGMFKNYRDRGEQFKNEVLKF